MNKKLVAVLVAGLLAPPLAAQAQTANVSLYGRVNLDLEFIDGKQTPVCNPPGSTNCYQPNPTVSRLSSNTSRLGVRGTESLGGGLNVIFQLESNVSADTGNSPTSGFASRETFVGLQGAWGTFRMGKFFIFGYSTRGNTCGFPRLLQRDIPGLRALGAFLRTGHGTITFRNQ
jgi:predicted porin